MIPDSVLLPYQSQAIVAIESSRVTVWEKSRRIGATWGIAALSVLTSAKDAAQGGQDTLYIGFSRDLAREFIDAAADWAKQFGGLASAAAEFLFNDGEKDIQAFRIVFASGFQIVALTSRPRSLRGRQGFVIIDEAAFHDDLPGVLKAALALLMWGGRVLVISSHNGVDHPFNHLVDDCRTGRKPYKLLRTTFDDAVAQGIYTRVCLRLGKEYSIADEQQWVAHTRAEYGEDASEELDVIPSQSGGHYLSRTLVEARTATVPVVRWAVKDEFVDYGDERRFSECEDWIQHNLAPLVSALPSGLRSSVGEDFGRSGDLTVLWPLLTETDLRRSTPFVVELRNIPFRQQEQIVFWLCDHLPRFSGAAFDARGNGQYLAEVARQRYGAETIQEIMLTEGWYRENMPKLKAALEDAEFDLPKDADLVDDFRSLEVIRGVPRVPEQSRKGSTGQRHGDGVVAAALALFASLEIDAGPLEFATAGAWVSSEAFGGETRSSDLTGFM